MTARSVAIFLPNFASGGAERVQLNLAAEFMRNGWDVTFVMQHAEGPLLPQVPKGAKIISLDAGGTFSALVPLYHYLKNEKPTVLLSNLGHNNIVAVWAVALARVKTKLVVCQHSVLSLECYGRKNWRARILPTLSRMFLRFADGVVGVSKGVADDLAKVAGIARERVSVIYNPVILDDFELRVKEPVTEPWLADKLVPVIIAAGRLVELKDFYTLIAAFAKVRKTLDCRLIILGEGPLMQPLNDLALTLDIGASIKFAGFQPNILPYMCAADLLVMSSRFEGFGNVLVEAMACGTQVLSTNCPFGPAEILDNGKYGALVPVGDAASMAEAIMKALSEPADKAALISRGKEFSAARSAQSYLALFEAHPTSALPA